MSFRLPSQRGRSIALAILFAAMPVLSFAAAPALVMDGKSTPLTHVYAFETVNVFAPTEKDVTVMFVDREINAATLSNPLELRKQILEGKLQLLAIGIDKDKSPYNMELFHPAMAPGVQMAGGSQVGLELKKLTATHITGRIFTSEPKKLADHTWSFDGSFDLAVTPLATSSLPRQFLDFASTWMGPGDKAWAVLSVDGSTTVLGHVYAQSVLVTGEKDKRDVNILFSSDEFKTDSVHSFEELYKLAMDSGKAAVLITLDDTKTAHSGQVFHPKLSPGIAVSGTQQFDFEEVRFSPDGIEGRLSRKPSDAMGHKWSFDSVFSTSVRDLAPKGTPLPADGGAPGKAYRAYIAAFAKGDLDTLRGLVSAERAKEMDNPDFKKMFAMMKEMVPKQVKITGGLIDVSRATLKVHAQVMGDDSDGEVTMVLEQKKWKVANEAWVHHSK